MTYPQVLVNVRVRERRDLASVPAIAEVMTAWNRDWSAMAVCWSATRAPSRCCGSCSRAAIADEIAAWADEIAQVVKQELG